MLHEGKEVVRTAQIKDLTLDAHGWMLILIEDRGWRAVKKNTGSVTFYYDDYFDAIIEALTVQKRYCND